MVIMKSKFLHLTPMVLAGVFALFCGYSLYEIQCKALEVKITATEVKNIGESVKILNEKISKIHADLKIIQLDIEKRYDAMLKNPTFDSVTVKHAGSDAKISLYFNEDGTFRQVFYDASGTERVFVGINDQGGSAIRLKDKNGKTRISMGTNGNAPNESGAGLLVASPNEKPAIVLKAQQNLHAIHLINPTTNDENVRILSTSEGHSGFINLGKNGKTLTFLGDIDGRSFYQMGDEYGVPRFVMGSAVSELSPFVLKMLNEKGQVRLMSGIADDGVSFFTFMKDSQKPAFNLTANNKGDFASYVYKSPGQVAWETLSGVSTGKTLLDIFGVGNRR
ncbi:hypothetical protein [Labrenzia sp. R5_0]|uniref:hypothetical protein n=1 Tax=Labrenzia sp. R5_0 TaxID=2821108 RepID=UPI001ADA2607|nr:hypothetical protein [Labrenzia sp. R5_0]MBO9462478.1 hypothetical protein [Labrenzia sp. R5_0]